MASIGSWVVIACFAVLLKDASCNCGCSCSPALTMNVPSCGGPVITELVPALEYGDVSLAGDLPIGGTIKVKGCFPVYGLIAVEGNVPSSGSAVVNTGCGSPDCNCQCCN